MKILISVIVIFIIWSLWGYFSSRVEQAEYSVIEKNKEYEIREYSPHIVAQTKVSGDYDKALNEGFSIIAGYIFGGNTQKESIAMTAPVKEVENKSEKIAMTAPVTASIEGETRTISFVMPKKYTLETLPTPNDFRVELVQVPTTTMAVIRFSWFRNSGRVDKMKEKLMSVLERDGIETVGEIYYAGYNAPWTPPWMNRNEVLIEIKK